MNYIQVWGVLKGNHVCLHEPIVLCVWNALCCSCFSVIGLSSLGLGPKSQNMTQTEQPNSISLFHIVWTNSVFWLVVDSIQLLDAMVAPWICKWRWRQQFHLLWKLPTTDKAQKMLPGDKVFFLRPFLNNFRKIAKNASTISMKSSWLGSTCLSFAVHCMLHEEVDSPLRLQCRPWWTEK